MRLFLLSPPLLLLLSPLSLLLQGRAVSKCGKWWGQRTPHEQLVIHGECEKLAESGGCWQMGRVAKASTCDENQHGRIIPGMIYFRVHMYICVYIYMLELHEAWQHTLQHSFPHQPSGITVRRSSSRSLSFRISSCRAASSWAVTWGAFLWPQSWMGLTLW